MPAEILLGQLSEAKTEDEVRDVLRQAFLSVERDYFNESIGSKLAERATFISEMTPNESPYETFREYPQVLAQLNKEIESGTTAVVALIFNGKLYVSNVG
jgi:TAK1-binding protein 1